MGKLYGALAFPIALPFPYISHNNSLIPRSSPPPTVACKTTGKVLNSLEETVMIAEGSLSWGGTIEWAIPLTRAAPMGECYSTAKNT